MNVCNVNGCRCEAAKQVMMCFITNEDETLQQLCASVIVILMSQVTECNCAGSVSS